jgi:Phage integrase family
MSPKRFSMERISQGTAAAAGIEGASFHILRRTYASHAAMDGMPIEVLAQQLGYKDTRITTRHYAHLCPNYKKQIVKATHPHVGFKPAREPPAPLSEALQPPLPAPYRKGQLLTFLPTGTA